MMCRRATLADARAIATIHVRSWQAAYKGIVPSEYLDALSIDQREDVWRQRLQHGGADTWLAERNEHPVAWISTGPSRDPGAHASTGELYALYVHPDYWRRGVGRCLSNDAERRLKASGVSEITLWVLEENERAIAFYQSNQFVTEAGVEKTVQLGAAELIEIRLRKQIGG